MLNFDRDNIDATNKYLKNNGLPEVSDIFFKSAEKISELLGENIESACTVGSLGFGLPREILLAYSYTLLGKLLEEGKIIIKTQKEEN